MTRKLRSVGLCDLYWKNVGKRGRTLRVLRPAQLLFAIIVAILYGIDLVHVTNTNTSASPEWVYAEVAVALSGITSLVFFLVPVVHCAWSIWDGVLAIIWLAQAGVFGNIFITQGTPDEPHASATLSLARMRAAVWVDLINLLLWLLTCILGMTRCCYTRKSRRQQSNTPENAVRSIEKDAEKGVDYSPSLLIDKEQEECAPPPYRENRGEVLTACLK
ncbi:Uncharacterized protein PECH_001615 [Penicillium ucsense]|uniref:MARVEL domain-containing protein n=1 Tax=Penicillium ucsense TaxID=2839758 RepID=A0A8J8WFG8_9EURO|nr:Uncharacterized protein PECM_001426 [Penicillium ucsense]KAF7732638.1 Uncharacterized protein PECH_001615 [Penicillium ucsense]